MNIVGGFVVVADLYVLPHHRGQHVRVILATLLVNGYGVFGDVEGSVAQAIFDVDEHIGQLAIVGHDGLRHVRTLAGSVLTHVNLLPFRGRTAEGHSTTHAGRGRRVNWHRGRRRFYFRVRRGALLFVGVLLLAAARQ